MEGKNPKKRRRKGNMKENKKILRINELDESMLIFCIHFLIVSITILIITVKLLYKKLLIF